MGKTPDEKDRTRSKSRKRRAQARPANAKEAAAAAGDPRRVRAAVKRVRAVEEKVAMLALPQTPKTLARVRGRSTQKSRKPESAGRGR
jgi:hypothetical protein